MARHRKNRTDSRTLCEAEVIPGLEDWAVSEIEQSLSVIGDVIPFNGAVQFRYRGDLTRLLTLTTVQSVYLVEHYDIPRPKAFLGDQHFRRLSEQLSGALRLHPHGSFQSLSIAAAGSQSSVMVRLLNALADELNLKVNMDSGDLVLRLIRPRDRSGGWAAMVRLSPRPLGTRDWRICNMEGALNATVARVMVLMSQPSSNDRCLNLACGSGTLMIERLRECNAELMIGCDVSSVALNCCQQNMSQSRPATVSMQQWDAKAMPIGNDAIDVVMADLPFGNLIGSHDTNVSLYPAVLAEASRVVRAGGKLVVITHEIKLMGRILRESTDWHAHSVTQITLSGLHPSIYVLHRL